LTLGQNQVEGNVLGAIEGLRAVGTMDWRWTAFWTVISFRAGRPTTSLSRESAVSSSGVAHEHRSSLWLSDAALQYALR
jgi:hypothetical protein